MFHLSLLEKKPLAVIITIFYTIPFAIAQSFQSQQWPIGTLASASTIHAPLTGAVPGVPGQFTADKAIDNDATTFWNDNTREGDPKAPYPDIFRLTIGSVVNLDGLMLLSQNDGWPLNYTVETSLNGAGWTLAATVQLSNVVLRFIRFENGPLSVKQLRINVTAAMGDFTRIAELSPIYASTSSNSTIDDPLSTSTPSSTRIPLSTSSQKKSNTVGIIAGVLGGVVGILLAALGYFLWLLRKQRNHNISTVGVKEVGDGNAVGTQKSSVSDSSYHTHVASELDVCAPHETGGYLRNELA